MSCNDNKTLTLDAYGFARAIRDIDFTKDDIRPEFVSAILTPDFHTVRIYESSSNLLYTTTTNHGKFPITAQDIQDAIIGHPDIYSGFWDHTRVIGASSDGVLDIAMECRDLKSRLDIEKDLAAA